MDAAVSRALQESGNASYVEPVLQVLRAIHASKDDENLYALVEENMIKEDYLVLADIIGNTVCADLFDYIKRDHLMTGIRATYDERILRYFAVGTHRFSKKDPLSGKHQEKTYRRVVINLIRHGRVRNDALADLLDILKLRYNLSDKVLFHPRKCSADAMLIKAVRQLGLKAEDLLKHSDDGLLDAHRDHPLIGMIRAGNLFKPVFACGKDEVSTFHDKFTKEELLTSLQTNHSLRNAIEANLEEELGLPRSSSVLIFCPAPTMTLKPIRALVKWKDGTIRRLNEITEMDDVVTARQVALLQDIYPRLWRLYLFVHPDLRSQGHKIKEAFLEALSLKANISAKGDPALEHYLENGCDDYWYGHLIDRTLEHAPEYVDLPLGLKTAVTQECHAKLRQRHGSSPDDQYADLAVDTIAQRNEESASKVVEGIIRPILRKTRGKKGSEDEGQLLV